MMPKVVVTMLVILVGSFLLPGRFMAAHQPFRRSQDDRRKIRGGPERSRAIL